MNAKIDSHVLVTPISGDVEAEEHAGEDGIIRKFSTVEGWWGRVVEVELLPSGKTPNLLTFWELDLTVVGGSSWLG